MGWTLAWRGQLRATAVQAPGGVQASDGWRAAPSSSTERDGGADPEGLVSLPFCSKKLRILGLVPVALRGSVTVLGVCGKGKVNAGEREPKLRSGQPLHTGD